MTTFRPRLLAVPIIATVALLLSLVFASDAMAGAGPAFPIERVGAQNTDVAAIQLLLRAHGRSTPVDGRLGPETARAVRSFQARRGMTIDTVVGPLTWRALLVTVGRSQPAPAPAVLAVKLLLGDGRAPSNPADLRDFVAHTGPTYDLATVASVRAVQRRNHLVVDGVVGPATWRLLAGDPANRRRTGSGVARPVMVLQSDGLGFFVGGSSIRQMPFGSPVTAVRTAVTATLGRLVATSLPECGQGPRTEASHGGFSLLFDGGRFVGWTDQGRSGQRLTTGDGLGIGSTLAVLRRSLGTVTVSASSLGVEWSVEGGLSGLLAGRLNGSTVTVISGGETCFFR